MALLRKQSETDDVNNYRPITLISNMQITGNYYAQHAKSTTESSYP